MSSGGARESRGNKRGFYKAVGIIEAVPNNPEWNYGGKVCLPPQFLESHAENLPTLMVLDIVSQANDDLHVKCGVIDFNAEPGQIWLPQWMMERLKLGKKDEVTVTLMAGEALPKATSLLFAADEVGDLLRLGAKVILERHLRSFPILSRDEVIPIEFNGKIYPLKIAGTQPSDHVITVDTDIVVDFVFLEDKELAIPYSPLRFLRK